MIIRQEQVATMTRRREEEFAQRYLSFFRELWPTHTPAYSDDRLRTRLADLAHQAHEFGIEGDQSVLRYANIQFGFQGQLSDPQIYPETAAVLRDRELDGNEKLESLTIWAQKKAAEPARPR